MSKTLGLDLGTNSIGWALIDENKNKILGIGSRIFPEGVENLGDGERETSKNASRTENRGKRRQFFRKRLRKRLLLRELCKSGLCPVSYDKVKVWTNNEVFDDKEFQKWIKLNPYELREKAINEKLELHELGRIFYHLIQRRGYQSNSRNAGSDDGAIFKGKPKEGKIGIDDTRKSIEEYKTLGSYLNTIRPKEDEAFIDNLERVRNRYTTRQMYVDEFETIWEHQKQFHSILTDGFKTFIGGRKRDGYKDDGILFHQRPLKSQKKLVGKCSFEPTKTKCPISAIPFEEFRVYQWINTVECNNQELSKEDKKIIIDELFKKDKVNFSTLRKKIKKADSAFQFNYKDDDKIVGTYSISNLSNKKFFGKDWFDFTDKEKEDIWHVLYFFDDKEKLKQYAIEKWKFEEDKAEKIANFSLKQGYANLSRKAINNILPFLKDGFQYDIAVALAGIKNVFADDWKTLHDDHKQLIKDNIYDIVRGKKNKQEGGYIKSLKEFMRGQFNFDDNDLKKLYHHSANIETFELLDKLPLGKKADQEIQSIRNPIVITALFEIRKLVNEIIDDYGKIDTIKVEMARDLKVSKTKRNQIRKEQKRLERENDRIKDEINLLGQKITHDNILRYKLWEECNKTCPYTGKEISVSQLFSGAIQIEHILPWSRSLNDSFMNKTLCFADENRAKGNLTPYEFYSKQGEGKWEIIKNQALTCFKNKKNYPNSYAKFKQFIKKKFDDDFISRQLNDTRYISKEAKNYLSKICKDVQISPGQLTSNLRHKWGLNSILNDDNNKSRDDHRHHAVDALVMACTKRSFLQEVSKWNRYDRNYDLKEFPMPWENFRSDAEEAINNILVSHKKIDNVLTIRNTKVKKKGKEYINAGIAARGQLHKESVYGKRTAPQSQEAFHIRKPLEALTTKTHIEKIVDPIIRDIILKRIDFLGGFVKGKEIPENTFYTIDEEGNTQPQIFLPNKNGAPVPVKKIRIKENISGAEKLKEINQYVNPRSNHHVLIYKDAEGNLKEDVVTFWTAVERKKQNEPIIKLPSEDNDGKVVTTLQINDFFILGLKNSDIEKDSLNSNLLSKHLYRVQKLSSKFYEFRLVSESKINKKELPFYIRIQSFGEGKTGWQTFNPIKVKISPSGKIEIV